MVRSQLKQLNVKYLVGEMSELWLSSKLQSFIATNWYQTSDWPSDRGQKVCRMTWVLLPGKSVWLSGLLRRTDLYTRVNCVTSWLGKFNALLVVPCLSRSYSKHLVGSLP